RGKEWNVVLNPIDYEGIEGAGLQIDGSRTRSRMGHQLGEHRIVKHGDFGALEYARVLADLASLNSALARRAVAGETAAGGKEVAEGVLGIHPRLDRPSIELHIGLLERQLFARCNADHLFDQIDAGHELGDGMLNLQARVHLQKEKRAILAGDEL